MRSKEDDGHLLLHAGHAGQDGYSSVMISSEDTDVFVMSMAIADKLAVPLFIK